MKYVLIMLTTMLVLSGCSKNSARDILKGSVESLSNSEIGYNPHQCNVVKSNCREGEYKEWQTSDGQPGCSCQN